MESTSRTTAGNRGRTWASKASEHIAKILVDPRDSRVVWVAAQGPLWATRRRPRPLQDDRRREDLEPVADDQREHRRDRRRHGPAQPRRALRVGVPAAAPRLDADRRRPRVRDLQERRRRRQLEEDHERSSQGGHGSDRARGRAGRAGHRLRRSSRRRTRRAASSARTNRGGTWEKRERLRRRAARSTTTRSSSTRRTRTASTRWTSGCR